MPTLTRTVAFSCPLLLALAMNACLAQVEDQPIETDDTLEAVPMSESLLIEPYTGPPIYLPELEAPPAATKVEEKKATDYYDPETKKNPRVVRTVARYSDESLKNEGEFIEYYENGQEFSKGNYDDGVPIGEWVYYHPNGTLAKKVTYVNGYPDGKIEVYRADGTLRASRFFKDGKREGEWLLYDDTGKQTTVESTYEAGVPVGVWQLKFSNGQLRRQIPFVDGKRDGTVIEWNEEGKKVGEISFSKGVQNGLTTVWTPDGRKFERVFEDGRLKSTKEIKPEE